MKKVLFPILALVLAVGLAIPMAAVVVANSVEYIETLYLSDSATSGDGKTYLYTVELVEPDRAELTPLPAVVGLGLDPGVIPFEQVDALACTPDGLYLYAIDKPTTKLGCYDLTLNTWTEIGTGTGIPQCVLAAFSSDGTLWAASDSTDKLYTVDTTSGTSTEVGLIMKDGTTKVNVSGADLVWGSGPTFYLWSNTAGAAPRGLYTLTVPDPATWPATVTATHLGSGSVGSYFTGLAIREGGAGDLIGSTHEDQIMLIDKATGNTIKTYMMYLGDSPTVYNYEYGDMTIGELEVEEEKCGDLIAGQHIDVGDVIVSNDGTYLYVTYEITEPDWVITETHLYVGKNAPPTSAPGQFPYDDADATSVTDTEVTYGIPLDDIDGYHIQLNRAGRPTGLIEADGVPGVEPCEDIYIAAHAMVMDTSCYEAAILYGIERFTGTVYGIDVLSGTSWMEFDTQPPPTAGSATPNGLAYDAENGRFYYCDYYAPNTLYFWDTSQHVAGTLLGNVADAGFYDGKYYYITGPPASDDLYEVTFNTDGTIISQTKLDNIADEAHGWTFNGDIAVKDGVVYGWGLCGPDNDYEFFTYGLTTGDFTCYTPSYQASLQLGFGSDGTLYGHRSGGVGAFYVVDTTNGDVSMVTPTPNPANLYTDCSSGEICIPVTETAWGYCEENGGELPGENWATYITYHVH